MADRIRQLPDKRADFHENTFTKAILKQIDKSAWDGICFQIPHKNPDSPGTKPDKVEIVELPDALDMWFIQPKANDSAEDVQIIHQHNRAVREKVEKITGTPINADPYFEG